MTLKSDAKFEEKLALGSKNDMMNLMNFNASTGKSEKFALCCATFVSTSFSEKNKNDLKNLVNFKNLETYYSSYAY